MQRLSSGLGSFQNIIVNGQSTEDSGETAPGQPKSEILTTNQRGIPINLGLGWESFAADVRFGLGIDYTKMVTYFGRTAGQKSSPGYSRLQIDTGVGYRMFSRRFVP